MGEKKKKKRKGCQGGRGLIITIHAERVVRTPHQSINLFWSVYTTDVRLYVVRCTVVFARMERLLGSVARTSWAPVNRHHILV